MPNLDCRVSNSGDWKFDSGAVPVTDAANWVLIGVILVGAKRGGTIRLEVGSGGDIAHLKFGYAGYPGDGHVDWLVDQDFYNAARQEMSLGVASPSRISIRPTSLIASQNIGLMTLPAGNAAIVKLNDLNGIEEISVWAKKASTDTTVRISGSFGI